VGVARVKGVAVGGAWGVGVLVGPLSTSAGTVSSAPPAGESANSSTPPPPHPVISNSNITTEKMVNNLFNFIFFLQNQYLLAVMS
jgi:hypothetical protein